jgi:Co/Zn/Cd efflux system component
MSVHVRYVVGDKPDRIRREIEHLARTKFHINHICIQTEEGE